MRSERVRRDEGRVATATVEGRKETKDAEVEGGGEDGGGGGGAQGERVRGSKCVGSLRPVISSITSI